MKDKLALIDTNILVYAYDLAAGAKHEKSKEIVNWSIKMNFPINLYH